MKNSRRKKAKKSVFRPTQRDIDIAKEEYFRNGGEITRIDIDDHMNFENFMVRSSDPLDSEDQSF